MIDPTKPAFRIVACLVAFVSAAFLVWYFVTGPGRSRTQAAAANATVTTADAGKQSAQDALKITVETQAAHGRIDLVTQGNAYAIRNAPGASAPVDASLHGAGLHALCLRDAYRLQPACERLLVPGAPDAATSNAGSPSAR